MLRVSGTLRRDREQITLLVGVQKTPPSWARYATAGLAPSFLPLKALLELAQFDREPLGPWEQRGRAAGSQGSENSPGQVATEPRWLQGEPHTAPRAGWPQLVTSVAKAPFSPPRNLVAKHSVFWRDQQECPSSDPERRLLFFAVMLFKKDKSWGNAVGASIGNKSPSTAISWWGWTGASGSSPGHQRPIPHREEAGE